MSLAFYRKYRPQRFEDIIGQDHVVRTLCRAVADVRSTHAYLFSGPRGSGKTTVARLLARGLNCTAKGKARPCNACDICAELASGVTLDLVEMDAASNRGIDEIRELREAVYLMPLRANYRVYIIDEVHMLTTPAFNALLKTLEEPPAHAVFVLATTEPEKVPDTIISRCQHFRFRRPTESLIGQSLFDIAKKEGIAIDKESIGLLALFADGSFRDAQGMLEQAVGAGSGQITGQDVRKLFGAPSAERVEGFLRALVERDNAQALGTLHRIADEGADMDVFLTLVLRGARALLLAHAAPIIAKTVISGYGEREQQFVESMKEHTNADGAERLLSGLLEADHARRQFSSPGTALELAIIRLLKK